MRAVLLHPDAQYSSGPAFSGGKHLFRCLARALAAAGHDVHVLRRAARPAVLCEAAAAGALGALRPGAAARDVVTTWTDSDQVTHHVALLDGPPTQSRAPRPGRGACGDGAGVGPALPCWTGALPDAAAALLDELRALVCGAGAGATWAVLDADASHAPLAAGGPSLLEAAADAVGEARLLLLLVQNVHFLPYGPAGCAARRPRALSAWGRAGGAVCVSRAVAAYVLRHALPLGLNPARVWVLHPAAVGAFGRGPFADVGAAQLAAGAVPWLPARPTPAQDGGSGASCAAPSQRSPPVVGCLKMTPEKGAALVLGLAAALPQLRFCAVCGDRRGAAAAAAVPNLELVAPNADVGVPLARMAVLLVPSLWEEAFGMVAFDAALRGVPALVSSVGGLPDAAAGAPAAVLPVARMRVAAESAGTCEGVSAVDSAPSWRSRQLPTAQPLAAWQAALLRLLGDARLYAAASGLARARAHALLRAERGMLRAFEAWLSRLAFAPPQ